MLIDLLGKVSVGAFIVFFFLVLKLFIGDTASYSYIHASVSLKIEKIR